MSHYTFVGTRVYYSIRSNFEIIYEALSPRTNLVLSVVMVFFSFKTLSKKQVGWARNVLLTWKPW